MDKASYERLSGAIRSKPALLRALLFLNLAIPAVFYASFPLLLILELAGGGQWLRSLLVAAVPFALLTVFRKCCNRPRPYEALGIRPLISKEKSGQSFPSRHVFSAFIIAMCWLRYLPWVGFALLGLGALLGAIRVVGGVHYVSDVLAGAGFAVVCGLCGFWL